MAERSGTDAPHPGAEEVSLWTDRYFLKTKETIERFGDRTVTYAVFMRRPVIFTPNLMVAWLARVAGERGVEFDVELNYEEGQWVGAGEPLLYITGSFYHAYIMCVDLPHVAFLAMDARHCAGTEMAEMMAYAASVGSRAARAKAGAKGFIGTANDATAHYFGQERGLGTMPHALIGYAGSTLAAAEMFVEVFPGQDLTVLVDFFGAEITDSLAVCRRFPEMAAEGRLSVRLDTHGGRFVEGLDPQASYAVLERHAPLAVHRYRDDTELRYLTGTGVTAAAIFHLREKLDEAGFKGVKLIVSSGFNVRKCKVMAGVGAPMDAIGTGSYLPDNWPETNATADIVAYDGASTVKVGREFLLKKE